MKRVLFGLLTFTLSLLSCVSLAAEPEAETAIKKAVAAYVDGQTQQWLMVRLDEPKEKQ